MTSSQTTPRYRFLAPRPSGCSQSSHLGVVHVVHLIENDKLDVPDEVCALVEHAAQDLRGHDEAIRLRVDLDVAGEDADRSGSKGRLEVAVFLVGQRLDRRSIDGPGSVSALQ